MSGDTGQPITHGWRPAVGAFVTASYVICCQPFLFFFCHLLSPICKARKISPHLYQYAVMFNICDAALVTELRHWSQSSVNKRCQPAASMWRRKRRRLWCTRRCTNSGAIGAMFGNNHIYHQHGCRCCHHCHHRRPCGNHYKPIHTNVLWVVFAWQVIITIFFLVIKVVWSFLS